MYQAIWIEGEEALNDFCKKRLKDTPKFVETIAHCGSATIWLMYKHDDEGHYHDMYLIFMEHPKGDLSYWQIQDKRLETYGQIISYRTTICKPRR